MRQYVVGTGRLLHPCQIERRQTPDPVDRLFNTPTLVGIHRDGDLRPKCLTRQAAAPYVIVRIETHLELDRAKPTFNRAPGERYHLLIRVSQPTWGRTVGWVSLCQQTGGTLQLAAFIRTQDLERLGDTERILQVAEIDAIDEVLRCHIDNELPYRLTRPARSQIPRGIDDSADCHMHHAFFRAEPTKLRISRQTAREAPKISHQLCDITPHYPIPQSCA